MRKTLAVVFLSGGVGSFCAAKMAVDRFGIDGTEFLFTDTKIEDEDLYRFLDDIEAHFGKKITRIEDGRTVWEVFNDVRYVGNSRIDPCSAILKRDISRKFIEKNHPYFFGLETVTLVLGIDEFEKNRSIDIIKNWHPYTCWFPLIENVIGWDDKMRMLGSIMPPRLYSMGFSHNNCGGFCVKAGQGQFKNLLEKMPERYFYHAEQERLAMASGINHSGIIRKTVDKVESYLTLYQFSDYLKSGGKSDGLNGAECKCFI